ncbi:hypothetical protein CEW83_03090 [Parazoarcus communis]|uniref:Uncharacterized protein n=2 Tax=Parazoarcus communis TaxID=41977 RepID=A0A2U8GL79_9RHOO|nr:hypothetical protein CEW83_03090 [Parazoarcus communis]|tara:strand:- start:24646 stop:24924 length:279 start_codon:yes stop_codon:yes gene_type:complete
MDMSKFHLHIDHLSLPPGFSPAQQRDYIAALEQQIAARIASGVSASSLVPARSSVKTGSTADLRAETLARTTVEALNIKPPAGGTGTGGETS